MGLENLDFAISVFIVGTQKAHKSACGRDVFREKALNMGMPHACPGEGGVSLRRVSSLATQRGVGGV